MVASVFLSDRWSDERTIIHDSVGIRCLVLSRQWYSACQLQSLGNVSVNASQQWSSWWKIQQNKLFALSSKDKKGNLGLTAFVLWFLDVWSCVCSAVEAHLIVDIEWAVMKTGRNKLFSRQQQPVWMCSAGRRSCSLYHLHLAAGLIRVTGWHIIAAASVRLHVLRLFFPYLHQGDYVCLSVS